MKKLLRTIAVPAIAALSLVATPANAGGLKDLIEDLLPPAPHEVLNILLNGGHYHDSHRDDRNSHHDHRRDARYDRIHQRRDNRRDRRDNRYDRRDARHDRRDYRQHRRDVRHDRRADYDRRHGWKNGRKH